jgi:hypothetical protein
VAVAAIAVGATALPASADPPQSTGSVTAAGQCVGTDEATIGFLSVAAAETGGVLTLNLDFDYSVPTQLAQGASGPAQIDGSVALTPELIATAGAFGIVGAVVSDIALQSDVTGPGSVNPSLDVNDPGPYPIDFSNPIPPAFSANTTVTASNQDGTIRYYFDSLTVSIGLDDGSGGDLFPLNLACTGRTQIASTTVGAGSGVATQFDFNGDGSADRGVYRNGGWIIQGQPTTFFGLATDKPVPADYNGDGTTDKGLYRNGAWLTQSQPTVYFGNATDIPVPADYNGDGSADRMVYRNGAWLSPTLPAVYFGNATDIPVPADYNGDGSADRMVYRNGGWLSNTLPAVYFGNATDKPVPADYNGDGSVDRMVYRNGGWLSNTLPAVYLGLGTDRPLSTPIGQ